VRTATIVLVAYVLCVIVASVWRYLPGFSRDAIPAIGALTGAYLGHTTRPHRAPVAGGVLVLGYLMDVISGTPVGLSCLVIGATSFIARSTQQRIFVRGTAMTIGFCAFIAVFAGLSKIVISALFGIARPALALELQQLALITISTAIVGPPVWKLYRRIDAAYARTQRDRDAALEGLNP
jgi:rod shape-determining protein MreD